MTKLKFLGATCLCWTGLLGCAVSASSGSAPPAEAPPPADPEAQAKAAAEAESAAKAKAEAQVPAAATLVFSLEGVGLSAPEAIIHDPEQDVYFVSNVAGDPLSKDGNGYISKVSPEGEVLELKFIDGSSAKTSMDAPKGMTISGDLLYVADITWVRIFDRKTGAPRGRLFAKGSTFLNGITTFGGDVFLTDSGWKSGPSGFENTGSDAIFRIDPKKVVIEPFLVEKTLGNPNGILGTKDALSVVSWSGEFYAIKIDQVGKKTQASKGEASQLPASFLDGVVALEGGSFLVSSWAGKSVYRGKPGGTFDPVVKELASPAAIGFDAKRQRLLIPSMMEDRLLCYALSNEAKTQPAVAPQPGQAARAPGVAAAAAPSPSAPVATAQPSAPPAGPAQAATPAQPARPAQPATAAKAAPPATPATPAQPAKPAQPATAAKAAPPATPAQPAKPATPAQPAKPATPAQPAKPATPAAPAQTAKPTPPAVPAQKDAAAKVGTGAPPSATKAPSEPASAEKKK